MFLFFERQSIFWQRCFINYIVKYKTTVTPKIKNILISTFRPGCSHHRDVLIIIKIIIIIIIKIIKIIIIIIIIITLSYSIVVSALLHGPCFSLFYFLLVYFCIVRTAKSTIFA